MTGRATFTGHPSLLVLLFEAMKPRCKGTTNSTNKTLLLYIMYIAQINQYLLIIVNVNIFFNFLFGY